MKLSILFFKGQERPYLLKRENGEHCQHAHFHTRNMAEKCRRLLDNNKYPYSKDLKIAMQRILTEEEFKKLNKKPNYININKGARK